MTCPIYVKLKILRLYICTKQHCFFPSVQHIASRNNERHAIIEALRAGRTVKEIIDFFNYNKDLVCRIKKQFEHCDGPETFTGERKTHKQHSDAIRRPKFVT